MHLRPLAATLIVAAALLGTTDLALAGDVPSLTVDVDPTSGPPGTVIDVSGECYEDAEGSCDDLEASLLDPEGVVVDSFIDEDLPEFAGELTVPDDAECGEWTVLVEGIENDEVIIDDEVAFTLTGVDCEETTTTTTTAPASSTTTTTAVAAAAAATPRFTG